MELKKANLIKIVINEFNDLMVYFRTDKGSNVGTLNQKRFIKLFDHWQKCANSLESIEKYFYPANKLFKQKNKISKETTKKKQDNIRNLKRVFNTSIKRYEESLQALSPVIFEVDHMSGTKCRIIAKYNKKDVAEILHTISDKYKLTPLSEKGYTYLYPAEKFLNRDKRYVWSSQNTNSRHIFINEKLIIKFTDQININKIVLLKGAPGTGKSTVAEIIGTRWLKNAPVMFLKKKGPLEFETFLEDIKKIKRESDTSLLIIEDAHLRTSEINDLVGDLKASKYPIMTLIIARENYINNLPRHGVNNFEPRHIINMNEFDQSRNIIKFYFEKMQWSWNIQIEEALIKVSGKNLLLLSYALKSLEGNKGGKITREIIQDEVRKDLKDIGQEDSFLIRLTLALSILSRFEIPTDITFLYERFEKYKNSSEIENALNLLEKNGDIYCTKSTLYELPHSEYAKLIFPFTHVPESKWSEKVYSDEDDYILSYFLSKNASNGLDFIGSPNLALTEQQRLIKKGVWKKAFADKLECEMDVFNIMRSLDLMDQTSLDLKKVFLNRLSLQNVAENILESNNLDLIGVCINMFYLCLKDFPDHLSVFWEAMVKGLCEKFDEQSNVINMSSCLNSIFSACNKIGKELWIDVNKKIFIKKISMLDESTKKIQCFSYLFCIGEDDYKKIIAPIIDLNTLIENSIDHHDIEDIKEISCNLYKIVNDSHAGIEGLWNEKIRCAFVDMASNPSTDIVLVLTFLHDLSKVAPNLCHDIWGRFKIKKIIERLFFSHDFNLFFMGSKSNFRSFLHKFNKSISQEIWSTVNSRQKKRIGKIICSRDDILQVGQCIDNLYGFYPKALIEIWPQISKKIAKSIKSLSAFNSISIVLEKGTKSDSKMIESLWGKINKNIFKKKINVEDIQYYEDFDIVHIINRLYKLRAIKVCDEMMEYLGDQVLNEIEIKIQKLLNLGEINYIKSPLFYYLEISSEIFSNEDNNPLELALLQIQKFKSAGHLR